MEMVCHQDVGCDAPAKALDGLAKEAEEHLVVAVIVKDGPAFVSAGGDMMQSACEVGAKWSCHAPRFPRKCRGDAIVSSLESFRS